MLFFKKVILRIKLIIIKMLPFLKHKINYQELHSYDSGYQENNWLVDEEDFILKTGSSSILEFGCGNGRFLEKMAENGKKITGVDIAISPVLRKILDKHPSISFINGDIRNLELPNPLPELVVSADVIEHFNKEDLSLILSKLDKAPRAFHKVACYDDGVSHLTIMSPDDWGEFFKSINPEYKILKVEKRREDSSQEVVTIVKDV